MIFTRLDLDIRIGSILGHHSITSELHAIHRNQKTYLIFKNIYKEWFALTNKDFSEYSAKYIDPSMRNKLEGDDDQVFTLGPNQWKGKLFRTYYFIQAKKTLECVKVNRT